MHKPLRNWAGNQEFSFAADVAATTTEDVTSAMRGTGPVKALGSRHSFNTIADSSGTMIAIDPIHPTIRLDRVQRMVNVSGGARYGEVGAALQAEGFALTNLASLPHISVAGACATGTHGSGNANSILASAVAAIELATATGALRHFSRADDPDIFSGLVVHLGALGVVTSLTLDVVSAFDVRQVVYERLPFDAVQTHFDEIMSSAYSVSLFTDWQRPEFTTVWRKVRVDDADRHDPDLPFFGALPARQNMHPLPGLDPQPCTPQLGESGPAFERLPHFRMAFAPSRGNELQTEYLLAREYAAAAIDALSPLRQRIAELVMVNEIRTVAADTFWMSPCHGRDSVAFHFTWKSDWPSVRDLLPAVERALAPFDARPHWGKLFTMDGTDVRRHYPRLPDFVDLARQLDPAGRFRNAFLDDLVFG